MLQVIDIFNIISRCINDIVFEYNGKPCGFTVEVKDYSPTFQLWYGDSTKEYKHAEDVINDNFFDGKSITDLLCSQPGIDYTIL